MIALRRLSDATGLYVKYQLEENENKMILGFSTSVISIWNNPGEDKIREVIEAYVATYGFCQDERILTSYDVKANIDDTIADLKKGKSS